ncbi:pyridoxal phosphate-dependent decarboxylase family protein [Croceimicrobium hydrocarbonivorans]|uniref:Aminotransferase class V-fold PLP-dependent enzyme n=1 Tax=Croceimicrobium hydrocarbonivorans TaxID=2761580 RepID=A0A7H0VDS4_9FLAO|nr:aminotransferase class V-fold PLP-dependent enzyme [Croceimicrobium hydrocarbonivorans]QNR23872.1 aminotransferase class V-fold PLP-dependent enzyme [Croceimicrobium hydrocarbonivorans]
MNHDLDLFRSIVNELMNEEEKEPVLQPEAPEALFNKLNIHLSEEGISDQEFAPLLKDLVLHTPRTATRRFFNQLFGGRNSKATLGDLLAVVLNNSMYTYKVGGPMVGVEKEVLKQSASLLGYPAEADGTLAPGGSMTNFMAMLMARDKAQESIRANGVEGSKMTLYTSKESHYSIPKNAAFMGIGRDQIRYVASDDHGRMRMDDLKKLIAEDRQAGFQPFLAIATAGTTVMGAFDPIEEMADICEKEGLWFHIDGAYCGSVIFSDRYRHLVKGADRADSFSYNAHKMLGTPLSCSLILVKDKRWLYESFANDADYLYQTDGDDYNLGKTSLQCGRRNDALKFWSLWKSVGTRGLAEIVDRQFELADHALQYVKSNPDYTVYSYENSLGICFNYKDIPADLLCNQLYEAGELMVGYGQFHGNEFVRLVTVNAGNEKSDIDLFFQKMEAFADKLSTSKV